VSRKHLILSVAATTFVALVLTVGSGIALAQVVASATGSGQIHVSGDLRTFTFNAKTDSSGVTTGQTEGFNRNSGTKWHGTINCLSIVGNVATMSGTVTDVSPATPPYFVVGSPILFQVIDNGEGSNAIPDLISLTFFYGTPPAPACNAPGLGIFATIPVEHGNVQVH
jgi:hypothetical protein